MAEATKLLKGVALRAVKVEEIDLSWVRSALVSASDPSFCLIDSGATNALRPAKDGEAEGCRVIRVDLASGEQSFGLMSSELCCTGVNVRSSFRLVI